MRWFLNIEEQPESDVAVEVDRETETKKVCKTILYNDETHTYDYVVEMLVHACELTKESAFRCAVEVDLTGRTVVYYGTYDECQLRVKRITSYGADHRLPHSMGSMNAEVQKF